MINARKNRIKKFIVILTLHCCIGARNNYVSFGAGPSWGSLDYIDSVSSKSDASLKRESIFVIQKARGFTIDFNAKYQIKRYITPYVDVAYTQLNKGFGFSDTFLVRHNKRVESVEYITFDTFIKSTSFIVANQCTIFEHENDNRHLTLDVLLGYSYSKFLIISDWQVDRGISDSLYKGFVAALKCYWNYHVVSFALEDYIYPEHIKTVSTRNSLLGIDAGIARYFLMGNSLLAIISYDLTENLQSSMLLCWSYYRNFGKATIVLAKSDRQDFTNPQLCLSKANQLTLLFCINYYF